MNIKNPNGDIVQQSVELLSDIAIFLIPRIPDDSKYGYTGEDDDYVYTPVFFIEQACNGKCAVVCKRTLK